MGSHDLRARNPRNGSYKHLNPMAYDILGVCVCVCARDENVNLILQA